MAKKKPETAVVAKGEAQVALPGGGGMTVRGAEDALPDQIQVASLRILQPSTTEKPGDGRDGDWYNPQGGISYGKKVTLIPIALFNSRTMWDRDSEDLTEPPLCSSLDGRFPEGGESYPLPNGGTASNCLACPYSQRTRDPDNPRKRMPSKCDLVINYYGFVYPGHEDINVDDEPLLARIAFQRTSYGIGEKILGAATHARPRRSLWGTAFHLATEQGDKTKGNYYVATMAQAGITDKLIPGLEASCEAAFDQWAELKARVIAEAAAEVMGEEDDDNPL
jgi:hypothetical protein